MENEKEKEAVGTAPAAAQSQPSFGSPDDDKPRGKFKITAKLASYSGEQCGVQFHDGVGWTNDAKKLPWFRENGFVVPSAK